MVAGEACQSLVRPVSGPVGAWDSPVTTGRVRARAIGNAVSGGFTALPGFSSSLSQLGAYRCLTGLRAGGEIIVGIPLLAAAFTENSRARVLGTVTTGGAFGTLFAAQIYHVLGPPGWRARGPGRTA